MVERAVANSGCSVVLLSEHGIAIQAHSDSEVSLSKIHEWLHMYAKCVGGLRVISEWGGVVRAGCMRDGRGVFVPYGLWAWE